mmetsp:Transcript_49240/g.148205  ORF Transcript_49240/g.148205 Transcript_49240/m.148205 type:complete len:409 (-) Transcript_49240:534-1760(-)
MLAGHRSVGGLRDFFFAGNDAVRLLGVAGTGTSASNDSARRRGGRLRSGFFLRLGAGSAYGHGFRRLRRRGSVDGGFTGLVEKYPRSLMLAMLLRRWGRRRFGEPMIRLFRRLLLVGGRSALDSFAVRAGVRFGGTRIRGSSSSRVRISGIFRCTIGRLRRPRPELLAELAHLALRLRLRLRPVPRGSPVDEILRSLLLRHAQLFTTALMISALRFLRLPFAPPLLGLLGFLPSLPDPNRLHHFLGRQVPILQRETRLVDGPQKVGPIGPGHPILRGAEDVDQVGTVRTEGRHIHRGPHGRRGEVRRSRRRRRRSRRLLGRRTRPSVRVRCIRGRGGGAAQPEEVRHDTILLRPRTFLPGDIMFRPAGAKGRPLRDEIPCEVFRGDRTSTSGDPHESGSAKFVLRGVE